jgi:hypothetical protein
MVEMTSMRRIAFLIVIAVLMPELACKEQSQTTVTQPAAVEPTSRPAVAATKPPPTPKPVKPELPNHPWVIVRTPQVEDAQASITADWTGGKRLEIHTDNIKFITLDLNKLPQDAPKQGPWTLQIDKQGIEIYGRPGMRVLDLARSINGDWAVVPDSHRMKP